MSASFTFGFQQKRPEVGLSSDYRKKNWKEYQAEIIELDGGACRRCGRTAAGDGVVLQVHHKKYVAGRKAWEYPPSDCETLCKGCHAEEHGIIPPSYGWQYGGESDLGGLYGACERCGTDIRYEFYVFHEKWGNKTVGTDCCDRMTGTKEASEYMDRLGRKKRFVSSTRWKVRGASYAIKQSGLEVQIAPTRGGFRIYINSRPGKKELATLDEAKQLAFDVIENGAAQRYLTKPNLPNDRTP